MKDKIVVANELLKELIKRYFGSVKPVAMAEADIKKVVGEVKKVVEVQDKK